MIAKFFLQNVDRATGPFFLIAFLDLGQGGRLRFCYQNLIEISRTWLIFDCIMVGCSSLPGQFLIVIFEKKGAIMKIENSFLGGCLYAVGYAFVGVFFWSISDGLVRVMRMTNIEMSPVEYLAYVLNGFSSNFEYFDFHIFIAKVILLNLILFYVAHYITDD